MHLTHEGYISSTYPSWSNLPKTCLKRNSTIPLTTLIKGQPQIGPGSLQSKTLIQTGVRVNPPMWSEQSFSELCGYRWLYLKEKEKSDSPMKKINWNFNPISDTIDYMQTCAFIHLYFIQLFYINRLCLVNLCIWRLVYFFGY